VKGGRTVALRGNLRRTLVASLLVNAREVRTVDQLIDDLWPDRVPSAARASLQNLVSGLRRMLGPGLVETTCSGYVLAVHKDAVDASRFERQLRHAGEARGGERVRVLEDALRLWRGSPLVDVRYEEFAQGEIRRLEELHVCALEELIEAKIELGACTAVLPELQRLVFDFPLREQLRMHLMIALHRSGRSVEALSTYLDWRQMLAANWDLQPGQAIQRLWDDIRLHAPDLEVGSG
jgi:SARP family transcriptional regulator, regulator of embCAB operon